MRVLSFLTLLCPAMLSYRHAFHAGNHADVLKHTVLLQLLAQLKGKDKPFWVVDTHAGAGLYALDEGYAKQLGEYRDGIGRLWGRTDLPPALAEYVAAVGAVNPDGKLRHYPGSPWLTQQALRDEDRLRLFELHTTDLRLLSENFASAGRQVLIQGEDGLDSLKSLLPPPPRRGLVLIDPSYEDKRDYLNVHHTVRDALARFATGVYAIWYPCLARSESRELPEKLKRLPAKGWLHVELCVRGRNTSVTPPLVSDETALPPKGAALPLGAAQHSKAPTDGKRTGMYGSGLVVLNPPWKLHETLREIMPWLMQHMAQGEGADYLLEYESA